jgi:hypothetical protein
MTGLETPAYAARRTAALVVAGLVTALLPLANPSPAQAAPETCPSEAYDEPLLLTGCDDTQPPDTTVTSVTPAPGSTGYTRSSSVTFTFAGAHAGDDDNGTIEFECQLFDTDPAVPPTTWQPCVSPTTYTGLEDFVATPYTFRVRAVDATDEGIPARSSNPLTPPNLAEHDWDPSPAVSTLMVDSLPPNTFVTNAPVDRIRPDWPVLPAESVTLGLQSNETSSFACRLNGRAVTPCGTGQVSLTNLAAGDNRFVARAVDRAFNLDPTPATTRFYVPSDIRPSKGSGWRNVRRIGHGLFDNDYVQAGEVGHTLVVKGIKRVREVRLIAPVGPKFGKIQVRVGKSQWYTVDLHAKKARTAQILVRDEFSPLQSGTIQIRVASLRGKGSTVRLDALVARR